MRTTMHAILTPYTPCRYMGMPWVGLVLYALHLPAILTAVAAGGRLLRLPLEATEEGGEERQPFLPGAGQGQPQQGQQGQGQQGGYVAPAPVANGTNGHQ